MLLSDKMDVPVLDRPARVIDRHSPDILQKIGGLTMHVAGIETREKVTK